MFCTRICKKMLTHQNKTASMNFFFFYCYFQAMARDPRNHYQDTPKQIKKKINHFKNSSKQYEVYLKSKGERVKQ